MKQGISLGFDPEIFPDNRPEIQKPPPPTDWVTIEELRKASESAELLVQKFGITKTSVAHAVGRANLFGDLRKSKRIRREFITKLAGLFGLTFEEFVGLDEETFSEHKEKITAALSKNGIL